MKPLSRDTPLEVEERWLDGLRKLSNAERLRRTISLTETFWHAGNRAARRLKPEASQRELDEFLLRHRYGDELATAVMAHCASIGWYDESGNPRSQ
ncbi:MAG: hypothetical protein AAF533_22315 [Acidobacteriota bacterium]